MPYTGQKYAQHYYHNKNYRDVPLSFHIAGASFYDNSELSVGNKLVLQPDENNKYDTNAIAISTQDNKLCGYVPKKYIEIVHKYLDDYFLHVEKIENNYIIVVLNDRKSFFEQ
jgi:hypothetical protein